MILTVVNGHLRTELDRRESVLAYLAAHAPADGKERTIHHIASELDIHDPTLFKAMRALHAEGLVAVTGEVLGAETHYHPRQARAWELTEDGKLLAGAISERYLPEIPGSDGR